MLSVIYHFANRLSWRAHSPIPKSILGLLHLSHSRSLQKLELICLSSQPSALNEPRSFSMNPEDRLPPLKSLRLINCGFSPGQAETWAHSLQSEHLEHLAIHGSIDDLDMLCHLTGRVQNLKSLEIRARDISDENASRIGTILEESLQQITQLEGLTVYDLDKYILTTVASLHGSHLRNLRYRRIGFEGMQLRDWVISYLSFEELKVLAQNLPKIQRLGIDLDLKKMVCTTAFPLDGAGLIRYLELIAVRHSLRVCILSQLDALRAQYPPSSVKWPPV